MMFSATTHLARFAATKPSPAHAAAAAASLARTLATVVPSTPVTPTKASKSPAALALQVAANAPAKPAASLVPTPLTPLSLGARSSTAASPSFRVTPTPETAVPAELKLQSGHVFTGQCYGAPRSIGGEVVFTTALVGYPESLTDPSYAGQILVLTQPLAGNYGVPAPTYDLDSGLPQRFESDRIWARAVVVADYTWQFSHREAVMSLGAWCRAQGVPILSGIDTRELVQVLRNHGSTLGTVAVGGQEQVAFDNPNATTNLVASVSTKSPVVYGRGRNHKVAVVDFGAKYNILRALLAPGDVEVTLLPHDFPLHEVYQQFDGIFLSNGPGDPMQQTASVAALRKVFAAEAAVPAHAKVPVMGICMGNQIMGLAAGMSTYKLKYGNRGHNQPCLDLTKPVPTCVITSQNHGYALDDNPATMPDGWMTYYRNANDGSNEGIMGGGGKWRAVQFHPEAAGGPSDTMHLFDAFDKDVRAYHELRTAAKGAKKEKVGTSASVHDVFAGYLKERASGMTLSSSA
ncbi:Multifunctional pyrimidine synthesis protein CAD [Blastocladiella emersonii ATCC 22665]|nr:Multifunctional pyrimidine synthesis protein CAD [Blastocladiella emersonii ATCC 22665]